MERKLIISDGAKGGVGKSTVSALAVEYLLDRDGEVIVVEGDRTIPDVAERYSGVDGVIGVMASLARPDRREEAIIKMFEAIESLDSGADVVVNTPASASETIDVEAETVLAVAHEMGFNVHVGWVIADDEIGACLAGESALAAGADYRLAIMNERFQGERAWKGGAARKSWLKGGGAEITLPELTERAIEVLKASTGRIADLTTPEGGQSIVLRQVIKSWLYSKGAMAVAKALCEGAGNER